MDDTQQIHNIADRLEALGNETRLEIFQMLVQAGHSGMAVGEVQKCLNIPGSTLSHHISRLVSVNLVQQQRKSRSLICRANFTSMDNVINFLTQNCCALDATKKGKINE